MKISKRASSVSPSLTLEITAKANKLKSEGVDVVSFGAGEPDFNTPNFIIDAAKAALDCGKTKYTPAAGTLSLRKAIVNKLERENGLKYEPDEIVVSNGAKHCLHNALQAILDPGDEVVIPAPYWLTYPELVKISDGVPVFVQTKEEDDFRLTVEELEKAVTDRTRAVIINTPNNPTGAVYSEEELKKLAEVILKRDGIYIISDEIYEHLVYDGAKPVSIASFSDEIKNRTIIVNGVSKTFSMTGWRIGYTASNRTVAKAISGLQSHETSNPNTPAQYATEAALCDGGHGGSFVKNMLKEFDERRLLLMKKLDGIEGINYVRPKGAFYVMMCVKNCFGKSSRGKKISTALDFANALLEEENVAVIPCESFGAPNFVRLSYAISKRDIETGADRIKSFVKHLN